MAIIPTALRKARLRKFWTPEQLAQQSDVGIGTIKAAEGSERFVHLSTVQALADALEVDPEEIAQVKTEGVA